MSDAVESVALPPEPAPEPPPEPLPEAPSSEPEGVAPPPPPLTLSGRAIKKRDLSIAEDAVEKSSSNKPKKKKQKGKVVASLPPSKKKAEQAKKEKAASSMAALTDKVAEVLTQPLSAFVLFGFSQRGALKKQKSTTPVREVVRAIGERWQLLTEAERAKYEEMAAEEQKRSEAAKAARAEQLAALAAAEPAGAAGDGDDAEGENDSAEGAGDELHNNSISPAPGDEAAADDNESGSPVAMPNDDDGEAEAGAE